VKQPEGESPADARNSSSGRGRSNQRQHIAQPAQPEVRAEVMADEPCRKHGLACIAEGEEHGTPDVPIAKQIGHDRRHHRANDDRQTRTRAKGNQRTRGHPCSGPENRNSLRLGQQSKAEPRCDEIDEADRSGEANLGQPTLQVECGGWLALNLSGKGCQILSPILQRPSYPQRASLAPLSRESEASTRRSPLRQFSNLFARLRTKQFDFCAAWFTQNRRHCWHRDDFVSGFNGKLGVR